jgi:hypothetical protein
MIVCDVTLVPSFPLLSSRWRRCALWRLDSVKLCFGLFAVALGRELLYTALSGPEQRRRTTVSTLPSAGLRPTPRVR